MGDFSDQGNLKRRNRTLHKAARRLLKTDKALLVSQTACEILGCPPHEWIGLNNRQYTF
jgi:hypothetical protein